MRRWPWREKSVAVNALDAWIRSAPSVALVGVSTAVCLGGAPPARAPAATRDVRCALPRADDAYVAATRRVLQARRDVWGEQLLRAPAGPTYAAAHRLLPPVGCTNSTFMPRLRIRE